MKKQIKSTLETLVPFRFFSKGVPKWSGKKIATNIFLSFILAGGLIDYGIGVISTGSYNPNKQIRIRNERNIADRKEKKEYLEKLKQGVFNKFAGEDRIMDYEEFKVFCDSARVGEYSLEKYFKR